MKLAAILSLSIALSSPLGFAQGEAPVSRRPSAESFRLWAKARTPAAGEPAAIGGYSAGCVAGAAALPLDGPNYAVMRPSRRRYFGHPDLLKFVEGLGADLKQAKLPILLVGDMGGPRGGPMLSGHASHQTGLDVDLWYHLSRKRPTKADRERWGATNLVRKDGSVNKLWGKDQVKLVELAASNDLVDRIFVHAALKRDLCGKYAGAPWLGKLRPWWGHADHLHVRLRCPAGNATCAGQEPIPAGDGCGPDVDWWFSAEAKEEGAKKAKAHAGREFPELPAACDALVADLGGAK
jgi:penicillin-insensitive murein DD-endopeptidase